MSDTADPPNEATPAADRPRDAASVVVFDDTGHDLRVLMGQRQTGQAFMPSVYVFPGGRVDDADKQVPLVDDDGLEKSEIGKLLADMKGHPSAIRAQALGLAGVRETFEEAGIILGRQCCTADQPLPQHAPWPHFAANGFMPCLRPLTFFARAITPPGRTRRFDTRFFCLSREHVAAETDVIDGELSNLGWYTLEEVQALKTAPITRVIIGEFLDRHQAGPMGPSDIPVPFYHQRHGTFLRELLRADGT